MANIVLTGSEDGSSGRANGSWGTIFGCSTLANVRANKAFCLAGSSVAPHTPTNAGGGDTGGTTPPGGGPGGPDTGTGMGTGPGPGGGGGGGGGGANGVTVKLNVVAPIVPPAPSLTVKVKLSFVLTA